MVLMQTGVRSHSPTTEWWRDQGYVAGRQLADGLWLVAAPMIYNGRLVLCTPVCPIDGWCYSKMEDVIHAVETWDGKGDPPEGWHRHINSGRRRTNGDPATEYVMA